MVGVSLHPCAADAACGFDVCVGVMSPAYAEDVPTPGDVPAICEACGDKFDDEDIR